MSSQLLVQALAVLSAPALAAAVRGGLRGRRSAAAAEQREAGLRERLAELEAEAEELRRTASCDPLTGVWNHRHLQLTLEREVERARRAEPGEEPPLALLMLEIAGFEAVVAEHGRGRAGAVLRDLAQRLNVEIRRTDTLARYGGEEFLVVLPDTDLAGAVHVAERLCWTVRRHPLLDWSPIGRQPHHPAAGNGLSAAVGIATLAGTAPLPGGEAHTALLLRAADQALGLARAAGGDGWRAAEPGCSLTLAAGAGPDQDGREGPGGEVAKTPEIPGNLSLCAGGAHSPPERPTPLSK
ncbi:GGDEF domain-containing protein [Kitasatospora sp. NPDC002227]|uniref:GGDEF domain-containing protein n=1 Tax=Kitasatospora sp. NPDC002227 TaxID=3154773 RepID=UPI00331E3361